VPVPGILFGDMATARRIHTGALRATRQNLGLRPSQLADDVGISRGFYSRLEAGTRQATPEVVRALAQRLGVGVDEITYPAAVTPKSAA
jgi:transcriptional regulator with XRE-family HTH domain